MSPTERERPEVCVGAVIVHDGRILLVRRGQGAGVGLWSVPGGRVEGGESMRDAVVREVHEETGLRVVPDRWLGWVERIGRGYHFVIHDFTAVLDADQGPESARAGDDADDLRWQSLTELAEAGDLVPGLLEFLQDHDVVVPR